MNHPRSDLARLSVAVLWAASCSVLFACDEKASRESKPDAGVPPVYRSGTRLKAIVVKADGLEPVFTGWHDNMLDVECKFRLASDGKIRCLPKVREERELAASYVDAKCSKRMADTWPDCDVGAFQLVVSSACPETAGVYPIRKLPSPVPAYGPDEDGKCSAREFEAESVLGKEVPADNFVLANSKDVGSGILRRRVWLAEDGAVQTVGAVDEHGRKCRERVLDGEARCVPEAYTFVWQEEFGDAECSEPVAIAAQCEEPHVATDERNCSVTVFALGEEVKQTYEDVESSCTRVDVAENASDRRYALLDELSPATLPSLTRHALGSGRLRLITLEGRKGPYLETVRSYFGTIFEDSMLGGTCDVYGTPEGFRCVPSMQRYELAYADAACTDAVLPLQLPCDTPPPPVAAIATHNDCRFDEELTAITVLKVGAARAKPAQVYAKSADGECSKTDYGPDAKYFTPGASVPTADLARLEKTHE